MTTPTRIHLLNSYVMHVEDCIIDEENTGNVLGVFREREKDRLYGALIPAAAIAYIELPAEPIQAALAAKRES